MVILRTDIPCPICREAMTLKSVETKTTTVDEVTNTSVHETWMCPFEHKHINIRRPEPKLKVTTWE